MGFKKFDLLFKVKKKKRMKKQLKKEIHKNEFIVQIKY